jgi:Rrf2 family protein
MVALARLPEGEYAAAAHVARSVGAPPNYLAKIFKTLAQDGLLVSQKGLGGGFRLARPPRKITLYDVVEPIEHLGRWSGCILGQRDCSEEHSCMIHEQWKRVRGSYLQMLAQTTIADLAVRGLERVRRR